jgi:threonine synthase
MMSATTDQALLVLTGHEPKRLKAIAEILARQMKTSTLAGLAALRQAIDDRFDNDFAKAVELVRQGRSVNEEAPAPTLTPKKGRR